MGDKRKEDKHSNQAVRLPISPKDERKKTKREKTHFFGKIFHSKPAEQIDDHQGIGVPENVIHESHFGFNRKTGGFETSNLPHQYQKIFDNLNTILKEMGVAEMTEKESKLILKALPVIDPSKSINVPSEAEKVKKAQDDAAKQWHDLLVKQNQKISELENQIKIKDHHYNHLIARIREVETQLESKTAENLNITNQKQKEIINLKEEVSKLMANKAAWDKRSSILNDEKGLLNKEITLLRTKLAAEASRNGLLQFKVMQLESKVTEATRSSISPPDEKLKDEMEKMYQELEKKSQANVQLAEDNMKLKQGLAQLTDNTNRVKELQAELMEANKKIDKFKAEDQRFSSLIREREEKINRLESNMTQLDQNQQRIHELESQLSIAMQSQERVKELEDRIQSLKVQTQTFERVSFDFNNLPPPPPPLELPPSLQEQDLQIPPPFVSVTYYSEKRVDIDAIPQKEEGKEEKITEMLPSPRGDLLAAIKSQPALKHVEPVEKTHGANSFEENSVLNLIAKALIDRRAAIGTEGEEDDTLESWM